MSANELGGRFRQAKGFARELWGELTGDESTFMAGVHDRIVGKLQTTADLSEQEAESRFRKAAGKD